MGLEAVKEDIIRSAKQQESALIAEARKEANRIVKEAEAKAEELKARSDAETKKTTDLIKRQALAAGDMEGKKMALDAKKQIIDDVFSEARKKLEALDDKKREDLLKRLLERSKKELEIAYVYCNKNDAKFIKGFSTETAGIIGGLIAENKEKTIRLDYSFETLLDIIKEKELQDINRLLFV